MIVSWYNWKSAVNTNLCQHLTDLAACKKKQKTYMIVQLIAGMCGDEITYINPRFHAANSMELGISEEIPNLCVCGTLHYVYTIWS